MDNTIPSNPSPAKPAQEICETATANWRWDGKILAQSCAATYPDVYSIDRAGSRGVLWDVDHTWSYQFTQMVKWFAE